MFPELKLLWLKFVHICILCACMSFCEYHLICKYVLAKVLVLPFLSDITNISPLSCHVLLNQILRLTYWMSL